MKGYYKLNLDGTIQSRNKQPDESWKSLDLLEAKEDGSFYTYYNQNSTVDLVKEQKEETSKITTEYKQLYLNFIKEKLLELDYDSIEMLNTWIDDPMFGAEATAIKEWYKSVIKKNYEILNEVTTGNISLPTKKEYLAMLPIYGV